MITVRDLAIQALEVADQIIRDKGTISPIFLGLDARLMDGDSLLIPAKWESNEDKNKQALMVRLMFALCEVQKSIMVSEMWQAGYTDEQRTKTYIPPSERQDRIEIVGALVEDREGHIILIGREIMRADNRVWLNELLIEMPNPESGRFTGLLEDVGPIPPELQEVMKERLALYRTTPFIKH